MCSRGTSLGASVCVCMPVYAAKNRHFGVLLLEKSPVSVIYCLLLEFNAQTKGLLCQATCLEKKNWETFY